MKSEVLISTFVFADAESRFSHDATRMLGTESCLPLSVQDNKRAPHSLISAIVDCCLELMSLVTRKLAFCICENKDADQLRGNREADHRLCFRYTDSTIAFLPKSEISIFCGCAARFVWDQGKNPKDWFSHNEALIISLVSISEISSF